MPSRRNPRETEQSETERHDHQGEQERLRITVDTRERRADVIPYLHADEKVDLREKTLKAGDYEVGACRIERKTGTDFRQSIVTNRLFNQCRKLRQRSEPSFLLIEGRPSQNAGEMNREAIRGARLAVSVFWCLPILSAVDAKDTANLLRRLARQNRRGAKYVNQRPHQVGRNLTSRRLHVLQGLPGIGIEKAKRLLNHFGSVRRVLTATRKELMQVHGLGEKTTNMICRVLEKQGRVDC